MIDYENLLKGFEKVIDLNHKIVLTFSLLGLLGCALSNAANTVTGMITYADFVNPIDLAISNDGFRLLIADNSANAVFQADLNSNTVNPALTFSVTYPIGITVKPSSDIAYVIALVPNNITVFNINTLTTIATIPFGSSQINAIAMAPDGSTLYVLNTNSGLSTAYVSLIDTNTNIVTSPITLTGGLQGQADVIVSPDGSTLYVANITSGTITVVDIVTTGQSTITSLPPGYPLSGAAFLAITPNGEKICVANGSNNWTSQVDLTVTPPSSAISTNSVNSISFIALTPDGATGYLSSQNGLVPSDSNIEILDVASNTVTGNISTGGFSITNPNGIAITANGSKGYIANGYNLSTSSIGYLSIFNTNLVPLPPTNLRARAQANRFLVQTDLINTITWQAPSSGIAPVSYKLYRDAGLTQLIATVSASSVLQYQDHNRQYQTTYSYYLVSVSDSGALSQPVSVVIMD